MGWVMELKMPGRDWVAISMENKPPYEYDSKVEAGSMLRTCYPDQVRNDRLSGLDGEKFTRIRNKETGEIIFGNKI